MMSISLSGEGQGVHLLSSAVQEGEVGEYARLRVLCSGYLDLLTFVAEVVRTGRTLG